MKYIADIFISLKEGVLDPQGVAVTNSLHSLGYENVSETRVGKYITVKLEAKSLIEAQEKVNGMCQKLLANPVTEEYNFEVKEVL